MVLLQRKPALFNFLVFIYEKENPVFSQKMSVRRLVSLRKQTILQDILQQRASESPLSLFLPLSPRK